MEKTVMYFSLLLWSAWSLKTWSCLHEPLGHCRAAVSRLEIGQGYCLGLCCCTQPNGRINFPSVHCGSGCPGYYSASDPALTAQVTLLGCTSLIAFLSLAWQTLLVYISSLYLLFLLLLSFNHEVLYRIFTAGPLIFITSLSLLYLSCSPQHSDNLLDAKHIKGTASTQQSSLRITKMGTLLSN